MTRMRSIPDLKLEPDALRVMTRPVLVAARFADEDGTCATLEGPVRYRAGDAIVTGALGEQWPISRDRFEQAYERVSEGRYRKRPAVAHALRLKTKMRVQVGREGDVIEGQPGDWLLQYSDGGYGIVDVDVFARTYETVADVGPSNAPGA